MRLVILYGSQTYGAELFNLEFSCLDSCEFGNVCCVCVFVFAVCVCLCICVSVSMHIQYLWEKEMDCGPQ